ncbi:hypothetical protein QUF72_11740 [Desulfobacterales bacterium HSG2]|nr:hypothetical protein [Desulfobacterales bacterium HSG2]
MTLIQELSEFQELFEFLNNLKSNYGRSIYYGEIATKQAIIEPLIRLLGWNTSDIDEVYPEYRIDDTLEKVDFSLRLDRINKFFIEVKKVRTKSLKKHEKQLFDYCDKKETELAVLTNGFIWWFYLPGKTDNWYKGKFYEIDIRRQDIGVVAHNFVDFLLKQNVKNGSFLKNAESVYKKIILTEELIFFINSLPNSPVHADFFAASLADKSEIEASNLLKNQPNNPQLKKLRNEFIKKEVLESDYVIEDFIDSVECIHPFKVEADEVFEIIERLNFY